MIQGIELTVPAAGGAPDTPAFAIVPAGARRGVVVIHEIFGRQPEIDRVVERFAAAGYAAVAPDLFRRGKLACLHDVFRSMKRGDGVAAQQGRNARAWLCGRAGIAQEQVGLIGFCFGGGFALSAGAGWGAVSANYGNLPSRQVLERCGPLIACYGSRDRTLTKAPDQLRQRLGAMGRDDSEVHVFDAGHSFLTDGTPHLIQKISPMAVGTYREAREEAWAKIFAFFDRQLPLSVRVAPTRSDPQTGTAL
jgi:carboxymethylenebutenolidase